MLAAGRALTLVDPLQRVWFGWAVVGAALAAAGCATSRHEQLVAFLRAHETEVSTGEYIVRPPDVIAVHAPGAPEIDGVTQMVRPDGKVVLRLLGEVDVAGLTTEEIARKLEAQLSRYYVEPEVVVQVAGYNSQFYYVFGEVGRAGPRPYTGRDTLLTALAEAQPTFLAWRSRIRVVRPSPEAGERKLIVVNLDDMVRSGDVSQNVLLQAGDIVEVPPTPLGWLGHRVRELLYPFTPMVYAYSLPADVIDDTNTYEEEFGGADDRGSRARWRR